MNNPRFQQAVADFQKDLAEEVDTEDALDLAADRMLVRACATDAEIADFIRNTRPEYRDRIIEIAKQERGYEPED